MKRLKYSCPFGGKTYPRVVTVVATSMMFLVMRRDAGHPIFLIAILLTALLSLGVCFFIEQSLSPGEKELVANAELLDWKPVTEGILFRVQTETRMPSMLWLISIAALAVLMILPLRAAEESHLVAMLFPVGLILAALGIFIAEYLRTMFWKSIDESAEYVIVPIDHIYDVHHTRRRKGTAFRPSEVIEWDETYIVCYLPDGRYILKNNALLEYTHHVAFVRQGSHVTWLPMTDEAVTEVDAEQEKRDDESLYY